METSPPDESASSAGQEQPEAASDDRLSKLRPVIRLLLWRMAQAERAERNRIRRQLHQNPDLPPELLLEELGSPSAAVRAEALRLLAKRLPVDRLDRVLPLLRDHNVDVRHEARNVLAEVARRVGSGLGEWCPERPASEEVHALVERLEKVLQTRDAVAASAAVDALFELGHGAPEEFWSFFKNTTDEIRDRFSRSFMVRGDEKARLLLLRGIVIAGQSAQSSIRDFLAETFSRESVRTDMELLTAQRPERRAEMVRALDRRGLYPLYLERIAWIPVANQCPLILEIRNLDAERYRRVLAEALDANELQVAQSALEVVLETGLSGLEEAVLRLLDIPDSRILAGAARYLAEYGGVEHVPRLLPLLSRGRPEVVQAGVDAVYQLTRRHLMQNFPHLTDGVRQSLTGILKKLDVRFAKSVTEDFSRVSAEERTHLIRILDTLGAVDTEVQEELRKLSDDPDGRVRATAAQSLRKLSDWSDRYVVGVKLLFDEDARVRANAIEVVDINPPEVRNRLREIAEDGKPRERANAIRRLLGAGERDALDLLERMETDKRPEHRSSVAWLLGETELPDRVERLKRHLADSSPAVRSTAIRSMEKVAPDSDIRLLSQYLDDSEREVRRSAQRAIQNRLRLAYAVD